MYSKHACAIAWGHTGLRPSSRLLPDTHLVLQRRYSDKAVHTTSGGICNIAFDDDNQESRVRNTTRCVQPPSSSHRRFVFHLNAKAAASGEGVEGRRTLEQLVRKQRVSAVPCVSCGAFNDDKGGVGGGVWNLGASDGGTRGLRGAGVQWISCDSCFSWIHRDCAGVGAGKAKRASPHQNLDHTNKSRMFVTAKRRAGCSDERTLNSSMLMPPRMLAITLAGVQSTFNAQAAEKS